MESLAAVSLVGNIVQFINLGSSLVLKSREIHQSTSGFDNDSADLGLVASDIKKLSNELSSSTTLSPELTRIAQACKSVAEELLRVLADVQTKSKEGLVSKQLTKWQSFRKAWKIVWKKEYIEELQKRLDNLRSEIIMHMFYNAQNDRDLLYEELKRWQASSTASSEIFTEQLDGIEAQLHGIQSKIDAFEGTEWATLNDLLPSSVSEVRKVSRTHAIIESLRYNCMEVRHTAIKSAHNTTFEWIFDHQNLSSRGTRPQILFSKWLKQDAGVFWITGKPGSGKSTLMKWLYNHPRMIAGLREWAGDANLIRTEFYFWNPGEMMQKSLEGLLQTLLHHIASARPDLVPSLFRKLWDSATTVEDFSKTYWTLTDLKSAFVEFQKHPLSDTKFHFHIDGLDEYNGDSCEVIDILQSLVTSPNIKLCLASRPWNAFEDAYGKNRNEHIIRLHDLTRDDIECFARQSLQSYTVNADFDIHQFDALVHDIAQRAQGVFLWVYLAVRSLRSGIINDDPLSMLQDRLQAIPTDLEDFFEQILNSVESIYRPSMASTFLVALRATKPLRIIHYYLLEFRDDISWYEEDANMWPKDSVRKMVLSTKRRLNGRFKGLLEPASTPWLRHTTTVDFLHRTLRDFLRTGPLRAKLESWNKQETHVLLSASRAIVAEAKFIEDRPSGDELQLSVDYASVAAEESGDTDQYFAILDQIEIVYRKTHPENFGCPLNDFMLRSASWAGHVPYISYRLHRKGDSLNLDTIIAHTLSCQRDTDSNLAQLVRLGFESGLKCFCKDGSYPPSQALVQFLLDHGADPHGRDETGSPLIDFFDQMIKLMDGVHSESIWGTFRCLLDGHFVQPNSSAKQWYKIMTREFLHSETASSNTLRYIKALFSKGLDPNLGVYSYTLFSMLLHVVLNNPAHVTADAKHNQNELLREFLRHGADLGAICNQGYGAGWLVGVRLRSCYAEDVPATSWTSEVQIFLEHGLDPNAVFTNWKCSLWTSLLEMMSSMMVSAKIAQQQAFQRCFVLCLSYGADPRAKGVQEVMSWMEGHQCELTEQEVADARQALEQELARANPQMHHIPRTSSNLNRANRGQSSRQVLGPNARMRTSGHRNASGINDDFMRIPKRKPGSQCQTFEGSSEKRYRMT